MSVLGPARPSLARRLGRGIHVLPLALGLAFLAASLTPSLIPRGVVLQGVLGGVVTGAGYLIGRLMLWLWRYMGLPEARGRTLLALRLAVMLPALGLLLWCLGQVAAWQSSVRLAVGMEPVDAAHGLWIVLIAALVFTVLLLLGWAVQWLLDAIRARLGRVLPRRVANVLGAALAALILIVLTRDGLVDALFGAADEGYAVAAAFFEPEGPPPASPLASGGPGSLVDWGAMGAQGRDFVLPAAPRRPTSRPSRAGPRRSRCASTSAASRRRRPRPAPRSLWPRWSGWAPSSAPR